MLPDTLTDAVELDVASVDIDTSSGVHIAAPEFRVVGSVHASGEAYVTIKNVYGTVGDSRAFRVDGSVHDSGHSEVTIENEHPFKMPANPSLPSPKGFTSMMNGEFRKKGQETVNIDTLVLFDQDKPGLVKLLDEAGFDCYDEVDISGDVHSTGTVEVIIDNVFIFQ